MREYGSYLATERLSVYSVLLPGHGTSPEDLEQKKWADWLSAVEGKYQALSERYHEIFLAGQSLGAMLNLYLASVRPCAGVIAISAGTRLKDPFSVMIPVFRYIIRFVRKKNGADICDPEAKKREIHYPVMPAKSIREVQKVLKLVKNRLPLIKSPVLFIHAVNDHVIGIKSMEHCYRKIGSEMKRKVILKNGFHVATMDYDKATVMQMSMAFINECLSGR